MRTVRLQRSRESLSRERRAKDGNKSMRSVSAEKLCNEGCFIFDFLLTFHFFLTTFQLYFIEDI